MCSGTVGTTVFQNILLLVRKRNIGYGHRNKYRLCPHYSVNGRCVEVLISRKLLRQVRKYINIAKGKDYSGDIIPSAVWWKVDIDLLSQPLHAAVVPVWPQFFLCYHNILHATCNFLNKDLDAREQGPVK